MIRLPMFRDLSRVLRSAWKPLVLADVLFKLILAILLMPTISVLFRGFLAFSGQTVLADLEIAKFLLHPLGWLAIIIAGGALLATFILEQAVLMSLSLASLHHRTMTVLESLRFVAGKSPGILRIAMRMMGRLLIQSAPFLAAAGGLYVLLLTDHDINYYLSHKPPRYRTAVILGGIVLALLAIRLLHSVVNWSIAIPIHLFENVSPRACLSLSQERMLGHRGQVALWFVLWLLSYIAISTLASGFVLWLAKQVVPRMSGSLWQLALSLGGVLLLWGLVNFVMGLLAMITSSLLLAFVYERFGRRADFQLPRGEESAPVWSLTWTRGRVFALLSLVAVGAALVGVLALNSVRLDFPVEITAHRGGAIKAPENTLAAIRQAIEDQTDWVEIDVQESKDGVVLVAHDSDLKKVSGSNLKIWEGTADELQSIDIGSAFGPQFRDERVPTLVEVLETCRGETRVNIELKYYGHNQDLERKVIDLVEAHGMESDVVIMSLESEGIDKVKSLRPRWTVGLLTAVAVGDLTEAHADFLAVSVKLADRRFIRQAHRKGKPVHVWTVNDRAAMSTMISRGADNLITDDPELARDVLKDWQELSLAERILIDFGLRFGLVTEIPPEESQS